jgi:hypothetical protein
MAAISNILFTFLSPGDRVGAIKDIPTKPSAGGARVAGLLGFFQSDHFVAAHRRTPEALTDN